MKNKTHTLSDGRTLGFAEYGDPQGKPVFHFGGSGSSRLEYPTDLKILTDLGIRLITTDRPGHGISSQQPDRELLDWPNDIASLADHLEINKFYVMGWSAGGPHALACAYELHDRIIASSIISGLAPADRPNPYEGYSGGLKVMMILGRRFPKIVYIFRGLSAKMINKSASNFGDKFVNSLPKEDQVILENIADKDMLLADITEGYKQGGNGLARDDIIINNDWKFDITNIKTRVDIWQGDKDNNVPANQAHYQDKLLPNSRLHIISNKGHMMLLGIWKEVLSDLVN